MDDENNEIVDLTRRNGGEEESREQMAMEVQENSEYDGDENDKLEENETGIQRQEENGANISDSNGQNYDIPDAINSEIPADAEQSLLKETNMAEDKRDQEQNARQDVMSNHDPKSHDACNHNHPGNAAGAAENLINNSHKEFLQVPTRMSTKKKRKDVHIALESTISDASKSSTDFSESDRDNYNRKFDRMYERSGSCTNCRKSRACCIFIYFWVVLFVMCSFIAIVVIALKVLIPYLEALEFKQTECKGIDSTYGNPRPTCSCGKSCKSDYPCLAITVTFEDDNQTEYMAYFSDNEATIGGKVRLVMNGYENKITMRQSSCVTARAYRPRCHRPWSELYHCILRACPSLP